MNGMASALDLRSLPTRNSEVLSIIGPTKDHSDSEMRDLRFAMGFIDSSAIHKHYQEAIQAIHCSLDVYSVR
jgi:hypothetical protein